MTVAVQLTREMARRLMPVVLLNDHGLMVRVINQIGVSALTWATDLAGPDGAGAARRLYNVLFTQQAPPPQWWSTPLGRAVAGTGFDPGFTVSGRAAADMLGVSRQQVRRRFEPGDIPVRAVLNELVGEPANDN